MRELSTPAKSVLMAAATLMIGFSTLAACRGGERKLSSVTVAHGDISMLYAALSYITWPDKAFASPQSPFVIGLVGKPTDEHDKLLNRFSSGQSAVQGRRVRVCDFTAGEDVHVLLLTDSASTRRQSECLANVAGKPVLTIGDSAQVAHSGAVLCAIRSGSDWYLELNSRAAARQQLKIDVRLVNVSVLISDRLP